MKLSGGYKDFEKDSIKKLSSEKMKSEKVKFTFSGAHLIENNKEYIIFAKKEKVSDSKQLYGSLGIYQG